MVKSLSIITMGVHAAKPPNGGRFNDYPLAGNRNRSTAQIKAWVKIP